MSSAEHGSRRMALALCMVLLAGAIPQVSYATTTQEQLEQAIRDKENLESQQTESQDKIDGLKDTQAGLRGELNSLSEQLTEVSEHLAELEDRIQTTGESIEETKEALENAKETERWQYECMEQRIQYIYENGDEELLEAFFSMGSFGDLLNYNDYVQAMADYDQRMLLAYQQSRAIIAQEEERLKEQLAELDMLRVEAEAEKSRIAGLVSQTSNSIAQYGDMIDEEEENAKQIERDLAAKDADIEALKKKIEEEKRLAAEAQKAAWRDISEVTFADGDKALLAAIIYCEAGGEPYAGKLAVGAVVINRLLSSKYPDTVLGVIYQNKQFSPVASGRFELALTTGRANADCYRAAEEAMSGATNVGNCLYFRTPIEGLTGISIGGHIFY